MNLHVFNDSHGFFLNLTVKRFLESDALQNNLFINLNNKTIYTSPEVKYLKRNLFSFKRVIKTLPAIKSVTFYPFDYTAAFFLKELKKIQPSIKVGWVFWGYEFYQQPGSSKTNLDSFSLACYNREISFFNKLKTSVSNVIKKILLIPVFNRQSLINGYSNIDTFYSFLPQDFKNVFQNIKSSTCQYYPISFLSIEEINKNIEWGHIGNEIMIGHAATPTLNHAEVLDMLYSIPFSGKLFLPLEYGDAQYRTEIINRANFLFKGRTAFLLHRLDMQAYYQRISSVGFAIFNFRWQESLGNILFLTWNGAKIFLKQESSVYLQFVDWGLHVFSIEHDLNKENIAEPLNVDQRQKNKAIIEELFSKQKVKKYWEPLL